MVYSLYRPFMAMNGGWFIIAIPTFPYFWPYVVELYYIPWKIGLKKRPYVWKVLVATSNPGWHGHWSTWCLGLTGFYWRRLVSHDLFFFFLMGVCSPSLVGESWATTPKMFWCHCFGKGHPKKSPKVHPSNQPPDVFQVKEGTYSDTIVANITDNPEPVEFQLAAIGALPKADLQHATCNHVWWVPTIIRSFFNTGNQA